MRLARVLLLLLLLLLNTVLPAQLMLSMLICHCCRVSAAAYADVTSCRYCSTACKKIHQRQTAGMAVTT
jgi:hypothetical protein